MVFAANKITSRQSLGSAAIMAVRPPDRLPERILGPKQVLWPASLVAWMNNQFEIQLFAFGPAGSKRGQVRLTARGEDHSGFRIDLPKGKRFIVVPQYFNRNVSFMYFMGQDGAAGKPEHDFTVVFRPGMTPYKVRNPYEAWVLEMYAYCRGMVTTQPQPLEMDFADLFAPGSPIKLPVPNFISDRNSPFDPQGTNIKSPFMGLAIELAVQNGTVDPLFCRTPINNPQPLAGLIEFLQQKPATVLHPRTLRFEALEWGFNVFAYFTERPGEKHILEEIRLTDHFPVALRYYNWRIRGRLPGFLQLQKLQARRVDGTRTAVTNVGGDRLPITHNLLPNVIKIGDDEFIVIGNDGKQIDLYGLQAGTLRRMAALYREGLANQGGKRRLLSFWNKLRLCLQGSIKADGIANLTTRGRASSDSYVSIQNHWIYLTKAQSAKLGGAKKVYYRIADGRLSVYRTDQLDDLNLIFEKERGPTFEARTGEGSIREYTVFHAVIRRLHPFLPPGPEWQDVTLAPKVEGDRLLGLLVSSNSGPKKSVLLGLELKDNELVITGLVTAA